MKCNKYLVVEPNQTFHLLTDDEMKKSLKSNEFLDGAKCYRLEHGEYVIRQMITSEIMMEEGIGEAEKFTDEETKEFVNGEGSF